MVKWWNGRRCFGSFWGPVKSFEGGERAKKTFRGVFIMHVNSWLGDVLCHEPLDSGGNSIVFCWASRPCSNWPIGQKRNFNCTSDKNSSLTWWICIWNSLRFSKSKASPRKGESHSFPCWMVWVWGDMTWWSQPSTGTSLTSNWLVWSMEFPGSLNRW